MDARRSEWPAAEPVSAPPPQLRWTRVFPLLGLSIAALLGAACGRTVAAGLEGELCGSDDDCGSGLVCERRVCLALDRLDAGTDAPTHTGLFFAVLHLEQWEGSDGDSIGELGRFIGDLSTVRSPYYGLWATASDVAELGRLDPATRPLDFVPGRPVTALDLEIEQDEASLAYVATAGLMLLPAVYEDADVSLDFDMPLRDGRIVLSEVTDTDPGGTAVLDLEGALRETDARTLTIARTDGTFSLYDVLRNEPLTVDTDANGVPDAWQLHWSGTARFE